MKNAPTDKELENEVKYFTEHQQEIADRQRKERDAYRSDPANTERLAVTKIELRRKEYWQRFEAGTWSYVDLFKFTISDYFVFRYLPHVLPTLSAIDMVMHRERGTLAYTTDDVSVCKRLSRQALLFLACWIDNGIDDAEYRRYFLAFTSTPYFSLCDGKTWFDDAVVNASGHWMEYTRGDWTMKRQHFEIFRLTHLYGVIQQTMDEYEMILKRLGALDADLAAKIEENRKLELDRQTAEEDSHKWETTAEMNAQLYAKEKEKNQKIANSTPPTITAGQAAKLMYGEGWTQYKQDTLYRCIQNELDTMGCDPITQATKRGDKHYLISDIVSALKGIQKDKYPTVYEDKEFCAILSGTRKYEKRQLENNAPMAGALKAAGKIPNRKNQNGK